MDCELPQLFMLRVELDTSKVLRQTAPLRLPDRHEDIGYLLHCFLSDLFGTGAVRPFRALSDRGPSLSILGYTISNIDQLKNHASTFADPLTHNACNWDTFALKPIPNQWTSARRFGFELRACPIVRLSSDTEFRARNGELRRAQRGSEVDVWELLRRTSRDAENRVTREEAYTDWLRARMGNAAFVLHVELIAFRRTTLVRRNHASPRKATLLERPDVTFRGELEVGEPHDFRNLLANGVGRHRAFGYGMLLLRPPGSP